MKVDLLVCLSLSLFASACAGDDPDVIATPKLAGNGLSPSALSGSSSNGPVLNANALTSTNLQSMGANASSRDVLRYAIYCALNDSQSASFTVSGTNYTYPGHVGLATGWSSTSLTT